MGDRLDIEFVYTMEEWDSETMKSKKVGESSIHLYSHWGGDRILFSQIEGSLSNAIDYARPRWGDPSYFSRIVMTRLIGTQWTQNLSWGIAPYKCDTEYPELKIYIKEQLVDFCGTAQSFEEVASNKDWAVEIMKKHYEEES